MWMLVLNLYVSNVKFVRYQMSVYLCIEIQKFLRVRELKHGEIKREGLCHKEKRGCGVLRLCLKERYKECMRRKELESVERMRRKSERKEIEMMFNMFDALEYVVYLGL
jgi:hypothetical protein